MNTIRRVSLGVLGVVLQAIAVEAKRGGGGGKSKGGGGKKGGGLGGVTIGIIVGMRAPSLSSAPALTTNHPGALLLVGTIVTVVSWLRKRFRSRSIPKNDQPYTNAPSKEQDPERNPMMGYPPQDPPGYVSPSTSPAS